VAVLATTNADGTANAVPVVFVVDAERVLSAVDHKPKSTRRLARLANIEDDARVSLLVHHYDEDWSSLWWVRAVGTAVVTSATAAVTAAAELLAAKYPQYRDRPPAGPVIEVTVEQWRGWEAAGA
jgi:PPOX class probable F420-dependent enzyme